jgi:transposase
MERKQYPSDVSDDEWAFAAPYLTLMREDAANRAHPLRELFNGLRFIVRTGMQWRFMPNDLPPWYTVYQQTQRWIEAGVFEAIVHDLGMLMREIEGRKMSLSLRLLCRRTVAFGVQYNHV